MMRRKKAEEMKEMHHQSRIARAKEAGLWLISSDVTGERGDRIALGPTSVIDPSGNVVRQVPLGETGMVVGEIGI
jgi:predicted amidohydrolase